MKIQKGDEMLGFNSYFDIRYYADGRVVSSTRRPHFTPKTISRYSFLLEDEWIPGLLNADRRKKSSKDPAGNRTRNLPSCTAVPQPTAGCT
jgi:hypothetical protein